jgi:hypothetical protein
LLVLLGGTAEPDVGAAHDERRPACLGLRGPDGRLHGAQVVAVGHPLHVPAVGLEATAHVLRKCQVGAAVNRDLVVVVQIDQLTQFEMAGQ